MKHGGGLTWRSQVGANPIPIPTPPIWRFRRKIALYRFNQGGSYYCRGAQIGAGAELPRAPLTLTTASARTRSVTGSHRAKLTLQSACEEWSWRLPTVTFTCLPRGYVFAFVCLSVSRITRKNCRRILMKSFLSGGMCDKQQTITCWCVMRIQ